MEDERHADFDLAPITVLMGHAGVGKTNVALGLALSEAARGHEVTLVDLDVVNPYFRSSDYPALLADAGIRLIAPVLARTTLDTPSLTGELDAAISQAVADPSRRIIIDVGGDDDGATAIGRWSRPLAEAGARVLYAVSAFRALTQTAADAAALLPGIEDHARLRFDALINTSNLSDETGAGDVRAGRAFAREAAGLLGLPLEATVVPWACAARVAEALERGLGSPRVAMAPAGVAAALTDGRSGTEPLLLMPRFVRTPWDGAL